MERTKIRVGISTCLLGQEVRYDGGHKRNQFIVEVLGDFFSWVPICPEVEVGMGTPRESVQLVRNGQATRMIAPRSGRDWTDEMLSYSQKRVESLKAEELRGYILKKDSPTCGMGRVKLYDENGVPSRDAIGLYAKVLLEIYPNLPIEEEGRLNDPAIRESFITRVFAFNRWLRMRSTEPKPKNLVEFHTQHKLLAMAHNEKLQRKMGKLVADAGVKEFADLLDEYEALLMEALKSRSNRNRHFNVMQHLTGFLKETLSSEEKAELNTVLEEYKNGWVPLITPMTLLHHHLKKLEHAWVEAQYYLAPYPASLAVRSRV
jgi:uncharacterized protein YbgA (DUF1722 family)/uncharacterized protein YbbK (DUF523 family)